MSEAPNKSNEPRDRQQMEVSVKPHTYQPSKSELEADITVDATPEGLRSALTRSVRIKTED